MSDFKTYMSLTTTESATEIAAILTKKGIPFRVEDTSKNFDASFSLNKANKSILIFLELKNFEKADKVIDEELVLDKNAIDENHFMYAFSNEDLLDVVKNPEEWYPLDVKLAKHLLQQKGVTIDEAIISNFKKEKAFENLKPEKSDTVTIWIGYVFSIMGAVLGFAISLFLINSKKTLPSGEKVYTYCQSDRKHGLTMFIISCIVSVISIIIVFKD